MIGGKLRRDMGSIDITEACISVPYVCCKTVRQWVYITAGFLLILEKIPSTPSTT
jgi:hypothetical protein